MSGCVNFIIGMAFSTPIHEIYSEASVGKAYLSELGITPALQKSPELREYCGIFMEGHVWGPQ